MLQAYGCTHILVLRIFIGGGAFQAMPRVRPIVGSRYAAGIITAILTPLGRNRSIRVQAECIHCDTPFECRFYDLKTTRKSCRCQMVKKFKEYFSRQVSRMEPAKRLEIFEIAELTGDSGNAAIQCGVDRYIASFAWQYECRRLETLPDSELRSVFELCQARSQEQVRHKFNYSNAQLIRICRIWKARKKTGRKAFEALAAEFKQHAPEGSPTGDVFQDAQFYLEMSLELVSSNAKTWGHYKGEFTQAEFSLSKRSNFGWVYRTLKAMPRSMVVPCFGSAGERFLRYCEDTISGRKQRRSDYLKAIEGGDLSERLKFSKKKGSKRARRSFLPEPKLAPEQLAKLFSEYALLRECA